MSFNVVFCSTVKGRAMHLERTLPVNLANNQCAKFVVLDYNSRDHLDNYLRTNCSAAIESGKLSVFRFTEPTPFRMAHAKNLAHRLGILEGGDILVNLDADNFTGPAFDEYLIENFENYPRSFMCLWPKLCKSDTGKFARGVAGRIAVTKNAFLASGGYDETLFSKWGPDDADFNARLPLLGYTDRGIEAVYLDAIKHTDRMRFREYPDARPESSIPAALPERTTGTVNHGHFGEGVVYRNFTPDPIELGPLPTRIFGIGMHKTGTSSLYEALKVLGYDSAHWGPKWKNSRWARAIWREMLMTGQSPTMEKSFALCDLPIALLFRELDRGYPGSKFILTIRNEEEWLESARNHWNPELNENRHSWECDGFSNEIHTALYGQAAFDAELFLARYRRHNAEVKEYFKHRHKDLLIMDMSNGAGFYELCGFLRQRIPCVSYPKARVTRATA